MLLVCKVKDMWKVNELPTQLILSWKAKIWTDEKSKLLVKWILEEDYELLFLDLLEENQKDLFLIPLDKEEFNDWIKKIVKFNFWNLGYIKLEVKWNILNIEMINMPTNWIESMIFIIKYALENWILTITWEANPRKKISKDIKRRLKVLVNFYSSFWFITYINSWNWWTYMSLNLNQEWLLKVLYNKAKIYLETKKWPTLKVSKKIIFKKIFWQNKKNYKS